MQIKYFDPDYFFSIFEEHCRAGRGEAGVGAASLDLASTILKLLLVYLKPPNAANGTRPYE